MTEERASQPSNGAGLPAAAQQPPHVAPIWSPESAVPAEGQAVAGGASPAAATSGSPGSGGPVAERPAASPAPGDGLAAPGGATSPPAAAPALDAPPRPDAPPPLDSDHGGLAPVAPRSRAVTILLTAVAALAIAGIAFGAGRMTASTTGGQGFGAGLNGGGPGNFQGPPGGFQGNPFGGTAPGAGGQGGASSTSAVVDGTVTAVTADGITVRTATGSSIEVGTTAATAYHAQADAGRTDVTVGAGVVLLVQGRGGDRSATDVTITSK